MLEVSSLNVSYGDLQVLWDISLEVNRGEIVALIGPNGAGKSTLLNTIAGVLAPTSGEISLDKQTIHGYSSYQIVSRGISLVPEQRGIFATMTVLDNLALGAFIPRARQKKAESIQEMFRLFPILEERQSQIAGTLSGGERQMLAIGRALMTLPTLLMLDEPSLGLAPIIVDNIFQNIQAINRQGITVLLVEQNVRLALEIADRAYILEQGRIDASGSADEILQSDRIQNAYLGI
jgi:branched-chain amino acid transport system ATP-binding protein